MSNKREDTADITKQLAPLVADDDFLDALSQGTDTTQGQDPLAGLLLSLKEEVDAPMPAAPQIEGAQDEAAVISLPERRARRRGAHPWASGLIGAAAATLVVAGSGAAVYNAQPGSALYGAHTALFGSEDASSVVELAATLEQAENKAASGDFEGARELINQLRARVEAASRQERHALSQLEELEKSPAPTKTVTERPDQPPAERAEEPAPVTETTTAYATEYVTVTVTAPPAPAPSSAPASEPVPAQPSGVAQGTDPHQLGAEESPVSAQPTPAGVPGY
ncbi:hypothetical protein G7Y31_02590 [Corynebacterium lizhenjunii]|uniref:Anti-sigma-D factor RsdA sigma factor binding region domain-containing protein n=1 Tax=Corynebacterium lizhenjunii TaxID=2709394 RepID=A0A7T0PA87_9CORY|nr:hypothetical protein [Corynebacterium lizhenjunii]QPK79618.1 hypothetical protein G7Y31_02590 [Corynebacterium lizhenjunii]